MTLFLVAVASLFFSSFASACAGRKTRFAGQLSLAALFTGSILGIMATVLALLFPSAARIELPWLVPGGLMAFRIDGLSAIFLLPAFLITATGALYGVDYWPIRADKPGAVWWRTFYGAAAGSIALLLAADNAVLFLAAWEVMALAGFFLVTTERDRSEAQSAGFLYLIATHTGTLALFAMFATLLAISATPAQFPVAGSLDGRTPAATGIFLLSLAGFGIKAGIIPLHTWLPPAHAAAPSHVSALMSGVLIKTGIYGLMRITSLFHDIPAWWGWTILGFGVSSSVLGVVLALAQHDIKRLLAYHSVENIGIILIGFGAALLGRTHGAPAVMALGLAGALLHVVNHGLFKSLLFYAAGAVIHGMGTRHMARLGGIIRTMPLTSLFFLGGAAAICGLPPLNGFVSEWLTYMGLLQTVKHAGTGLSVAALAVPGLALTGGLALLCFSKVFGLCFLGEPRTGSPPPQEAPDSLLAAMTILFACCLAIGLAPAGMLPLLSKGVRDWTGGADGAAVTMALAPVQHISLCALALLLAVWGVERISCRWRPGAALLPPTWGCGYLFASPRMQYSTASFAQMLTDLFRWALRTVISRQKTETLFLGKATFMTRTPDAPLDLVLTPGARSLAKAATQLRHVVQRGVIQVYLLYAGITLLGLLLLSLRLD